MRLLRLTAIALLLAGVTAAPSPALGVPVALPESITGGGHVAATTFAIAVRAGSNGENPVGTLTTSGFYNFTATVTCVNMAGSTAVSGYRIDTPPDAGKGFLASGRDDGLGHPAEVFYSGILAAPPTSCPAPSEAPPSFLVSGGGGTMDAGELVVAGGPAEIQPPWSPFGLPPVPSGPATPDPPAVPIQLVPERSLTPIALGESQTRVGGLLARAALPIRMAWDPHGRVARLASSATALTLYRRRLTHNFAALRPLLVAHGWRLSRHGATRIARHASHRGTTSVEWRNGALVRAAVASR